MYKNQIYTLSMLLDGKRFSEIIENVKFKSELIYNADCEYIDTSMVEKGIVIKYRDSSYKKKIKIIINSGILCDYERVSSDKLLRKIDKIVQKYFKGAYQVDDFTFSGVVLIQDINVKSREKVSAYLKVFHRINRVKLFSKDIQDGVDKRNCFCLRGNSNGLRFLIYDLEKMLQVQCGKCHKKNNAVGILRVEIEFTKLKTLNRYLDVNSTSDYIQAINKKCTDLFLEIFKQVIPYGEYYKKDAAVDIIHRMVKDKVLRRKMLRLVALIPEKKSLLLAQKAMQCREMDKVMDGFAIINLSPVTISKRQKINCLENLYLKLATN